MERNEGRSGRKEGKGIDDGRGEGRDRSGWGSLLHIDNFLTNKS